MSLNSHYSFRVVKILDDLRRNVGFIQNPTTDRLRKTKKNTTFCGSIVSIFAIKDSYFSEIDQINLHRKHAYIENICKNNENYFHEFSILFSFIQSLLPMNDDDE